MPQFFHTRLPNGLDVLAEVNPSAHSAAVGYMVRAGSRDEPVGATGLSHFLEHMLFKGTARRSADDINRRFDELGARTNAFTTNEVTCYWANVLPEFLDGAVELLSDLMRPALREEDFVVEKQVILEEIAQSLDRPSHLLYEAVMADHFTTHPMARSVLGGTATVGPMARDQLAAYFAARYTPGNMVLAAAGAVDFAHLVSLAQEYCGAWPAAPVGRDYPEPRLAAKRRHIRDEKLKRHYIAMLCPGPAAQDDQRFAAMVLADVLGDHEGSRLFWSLIEPGLADEADLSYFPHDRAGSFMAYASCDPERAAAVEAILRDELTGAADLSDEEIQRSKNKIETASVLQGELPLGRMRGMAGQWLYNGQYRTLEQDLATLEGISKTDLANLAQTYPFAPLTITTLGPESEPQAQASAMGNPAR